MRRRRRRIRRRFQLRGRGVPYMFKNKVYFGRKPQNGSGALSAILANTLKQAGDVIGI